MISSKKSTESLIIMKENQNHLIEELINDNEEDQLVKQKLTHERLIDNLYDEYFQPINFDQDLSDEEKKALVKTYHQKLLIAEENYTIIEKDLEKFKTEQDHQDEDELLKNSTLKRSLIVQSSFFYEERQAMFHEHFPKRDEVDQLITTIKKYFNAYQEAEKLDAEYKNHHLDFKEYQFLALSNDNQRKIAHNDLITLLNRINTLCKQANIMPLTYKNFLHADRKNINERPNQMSNDRRRVAFYAHAVINQLTDKYKKLKVDP